MACVGIYDLIIVGGGPGGMTAGLYAMRAALKTVLDAGPDVLNHNIETVPRLYPEVRPQAEYKRSLDLFRRSNRIGSAAGRGATGHGRLRCSTR